MYYVLFTKIIQEGAYTALVGLFFKKSVLEFVVKILEKYTNTLFSKTPVTVSTKSEVFLNDFFSKLEDISK